jgi:hypothetical protein
LHDRATQSKRENEEVKTRTAPFAKNMRILLFAFFEVWLIVIVLGSTLVAEDPEIKIEQRRLKDVGTLHLKLKPSLAAIRSDAPFWIDVELESTYPDLMEGELDLTFVDDREVRSQLRTAPMAIPNGEKSFRLFLPAMWARQERANFEVRVVFHSSRGLIDLGTHDLVVPLKGQRQFVMAAAGLGDATINQLTRQLGLDNYRPVDSTRAILLTLPVEFELSAIPVDPTGFYPFDVLVFAGEYFSRLSPRQLDTIAQWTETGGGLVIVPTGVLTEAHTKFLERLIGADTKSSDFVLDKFGRLPSQNAGSKGWIIPCRYGYGRALIMQQIPAFDADGNPRDVDRATWKRAVCFLWNVRPSQTAKIIATGSWEPPKRSRGNRYGSAPSDEGEYDERVPLHAEPFSKADVLRALLFPEEVGVVPFRVVATILTLFLLAIAPADYLILGLLRRRKYTWILFPAMCVVFTVATVSVARHYTGTIDHRGSLVITDLGEDGRPLRTTRIEHVITAGTRTVADDVKNGLFARTDIQPQTENTIRPTAANGMATLGDESWPREKESNPVEYTGVIPSTFRVTRLSRQWSPSMVRVTATGAQEAPPSIVWSELDSLDPHHSAGQKEIVERIRRTLPDCEILFLSSAAERSEQDVFPTRGPGSRLHSWTAVLAELSRRSDPRLFSIVSRISPNGAGNLEDLSVLDSESKPWPELAVWILRGAPTESQPCVLHIAIQKGDDLLVYRRLLKPTRRREL